MPNVINGTNGPDILIGTPGDDIVTGGRGDDVAFLGDGDDAFVWNPGDGSDIVEGQAGFDMLEFAGSNASENIDISANGGRVRFFRNVANVTMDLNGVERVHFNALGGADQITVGDMTGTDLRQVDIDLAGIPDGTTGDGVADAVLLNGSAGGNAITLSGGAALLTVAGLPAAVTIANADPGADRLIVQGLGGDDRIDAIALAAGGIALTLDGGAGDDVLTGSAGADVLIGGVGNDLIIGGRGDDIAFLGDGDDTFVWRPGDGSDIVEGQAGLDTLDFVGSNAGENIDISANGGRVRFFRDVANVTMDLNGVEHVRFSALGGEDRIAVGDMSGTDLARVEIDLAGVLGGTAGDGKADQVTVAGTGGNDAIAFEQNGNNLAITGLPAEVSITHLDATGDSVTVSAGAGDDVIDGSGVVGVQLTLLGGSGDDVLLGSAGADNLNGGDDEDVLLGGAGADIVTGGRGNDVAFLGSGDDVFVWNPGDGSDTVEGQAGFDTLEFAGSNASENIDISANGGRVRFFRDVANVTMDLKSVERIHFTALGGADRITVGDMTGTDLRQLDIDLAGSLDRTTGDGAADAVTLNGSATGDAITLTGGGASAITVASSTLAATTITHADPGADRLIVQGLGGNDRIDASAVAAGGMALTLDGGAGDDVLVGSLGAELLIGNTGNDTIVARSGTLSSGDLIDGGTGANTLALDGAGTFDLRAPASINGIQVVTAHEGQAAFAAGNGRVFAARNQVVHLRDGLDVTVDVASAALDPANPKPRTITIVGAHDAAVINLGSGNDRVVVGDARETVHGGSGDSTIQVNSATIGATIDGGTGHSSLLVTDGGTVVMGASVTRVPTVFLSPSSSAPYDFTANATPGLTVNDLSRGADTVRAGGAGQTLTGGAGHVTMVGFSGGGTTFSNAAAAFDGDTINGLLPSDRIDIVDLNFAGLAKSFTDNGSHTAGVLSLSDGSRSTSLTIEGSHQLSDFVFASSGGTGTSVVLRT